VVCSTDTCWRKPHQYIFEIALEAVAALAEECVMMGNSEDNDVLPAAALTIRVAIEEPAPLRSRADVICPTLVDAAEGSLSDANSGNAPRAGRGMIRA
jgi:FMN phosphatase YigB (HAD superfamily)